MAATNLNICRPDSDDLGILLMGVTGHGKSATGNTILGREEFRSEGGWGSVTKTYHVGNTRIKGRKIKVVDIPGFADSDEKTDDAKQQLVITALSKALVKFPYGFHAVLLVVSYAQRLTKEVQDTLKFIFDQFDEEAFRQYGILVVTNGDAFKRDNRNRNARIKDWLQANCPVLADGCGMRCVLFDNVTEDEGLRYKQVLELLGEVDAMDNKEDLYIPRVCRYTGDNKEAYEEDRQRVAKIEKISSGLGLLKDDLHKANDKWDYSREEVRAQFQQDIISIRKDISSMDSETNNQNLEVLDTLENDIHSDEMEKHIDDITNMQYNFDKFSGRGEWWKSVTKGVTSFVKGVAAVATVVGTGLSWLLGL